MIDSALVASEALLMVRRLGVLGLFVVIGAGGVGCGAGSPVPPVSGTIAYLRATSGGLGALGRLVVMRADGRRKRVLEGTYVGATPVWSPDGRQIAFFAIDKNLEHTSIDVADRLGRSLRVLTPHAWVEDCSWPTWAHRPDTVAFTRNIACDNPTRIYTVRADGTQLHPIFSEDNNSNPAWSPDGRTISYIAGSRLMLMDADTTNSHALPTADVASIIGIPTPPPTAWSPDGTRIYYLDIKGGISVIHRDNTHRQRVVTTDQARVGDGIHRVIEFAVSPNGSEIAFAAGDGKHKNLYIVNANGSGLRKLAGDSNGPSWSPDGKWIAFAGTGNIRMVNPDGRNLRTVSNDADVDYAPAWAPPPR
jgi:Tol biopolymer transport system component